MKRGIVITGFGHSGTTIAWKMLSRHPLTHFPKGSDALIPDCKECRKSIDMFHKTLYGDKRYIIKKEKLFECLDYYVKKSRCPDDHYVLYKAPTHPLFCIGMYAEYFDELILLYTHRKLDRVLRSYRRRGGDTAVGKPHNIAINLNRISADQRKKFIAYLDGPGKRHNHTEHGKRMLKEQWEYCNQLRDEWNQDNEPKFVTLDMHRFTSDKQYVKKLLDDVGLNCGPKVCADMFSEVDSNRI